MARFSPDSLARWTGGSWTSTPSAPLEGFCADTRKLQPGQVFVALASEQRNGHDFVANAQAAGAAAALVSRPVAGVTLPQLVVADTLTAFQRIALEHRRLFQGPVVGITGSCGKTSTKDLLALLLGGESEGVLFTQGNFNNQLGVPLTLTRLDPSCHRFAVVEAGISEPGEMDKLAAMIEPDVGLVTLIAPAHLERLGSVENVAREKARLPAAVKPMGVAVFPRQCAEFPAFRELGVRKMVIEPAAVIRPAAPPKDVVYFTVTQRDDITAIAIAYGEPPPLHFTLRRVTPGMAQNAVLAVCTALWLGVKPAEIQARLGSWAPSPLRGERLRSGDALLYVDCYNANPASMADALNDFCSLPEASAPRLFVMGCMGELGQSSAQLHRALGRSLELRAEDRVLLVGPESMDLREGLLEAGATGTQVRLLGSAAEACAEVRGWLGVVFIKGSRAHGLEILLPEGAACAAAH